jgi:hypothetical protein
MSDEILKELERVDLKNRWDRPLEFVTPPLLSPEQQALKEAAEANLRRLWNAPLEELLQEVLSPDELGRLRRSLDDAGLQLPDMFAFDPDGNPVQLAIYGHVEPLYSPLYDLICVELKYCERRDYFGSALTFALALLASLITGGLITEVSGSAAIVAGIRSGYFDKLCGCKSKSGAV